jgi:NitT/TauT family transport system substrate-binding protein
MRSRSIDLARRCGPEDVEDEEEKMRKPPMIIAWRAVRRILAMSLIIAAPTAAHALDKVKVVIPQDSVFVLNYMGARDAGVFKKHGIDIDVDARPFAGYVAGLPSKACMVTTYSGISGVSKMNEGMDLAVIGGGLTVIQDVFVATKSPIKTVPELRGKRFGVWSTGAGAYKAVRAALIDGYGLDVAKDAKLVQVAAPALYKLASEGKFDAMVNVSSFTIKAESEPDKFRVLFSPNEYWKKKTGYPIVWSAPITAWKSWINENPDRAYRTARAIEESFRWLRDPKNFDAAVKKYGKLAGVTTKAAADTYKKLLSQKRVFLANWTRKTAEAQWKFLEMAKSHGVIDKVPPMDKHAMLFEKN